MPKQPETMTLAAAREAVKEWWGPIAEMDAARDWRTILRMSARWQDVGITFYAPKGMPRGQALAILVKMVRCTPKVAKGRG